MMVAGFRGGLEDASLSPSSANEAPVSPHPPAGPLKRFEGNPVLRPIPEHRWESKYVFNAATIKIGRRVYMLYRAHGEDDVSRIGLAVSDDGFVFNRRLAYPIFEPGHESESSGCEDPRVTLMDGCIYMTYTAYDGVTPQIALASIDADDFVSYRWSRWRRHGLFRSGCVNKDAAVFPERFGGKVSMLHRIEPDIWITFSDDLRFPWPDEDDRILARSGEGTAWDAKKIGAGAQPIKTEYGWLLITHGVDHHDVYRLGVMLVDLIDPSRLIYRSPNAILEPAQACEIGDDECYWVPNVVFTCGAVPRNGRTDALKTEDELLVYYGGSDSVMNVAMAKVGDLIPYEFRGRNST